MIEFEIQWKKKQTLSLNEIQLLKNQLEKSDELTKKNENLIQNLNNSIEQLRIKYIQEIQ